MKFEAENPPFWGKFTGKIETLTTRNFLCRKFAMSVGNCNYIYLLRLLFLTHDAAGQTEINGPDWLRAAHALAAVESCGLLEHY